MDETGCSTSVGRHPGGGGEFHDAFLGRKINDG